MANTRQLRQRIKSVKNTAQITKAMQMVAATKMRRAQNQALRGRFYADTLNLALSRLLPNIQPELHPLLSENGATQKGVLALSTNKALCGALNTNLFRALNNFAVEHRSSKGDLRFFTVGLKVRDFVIKGDWLLEADFENPEVVNLSRARKIASLLINAYLEKVIGEIYLVYPHFVSTLKQEPRIVKLLPIHNVILNISEGSPTNPDLIGANVGTSNKLRDSSASPQNDNNEFLFEPNSDQILDFVLSHQVETQIYQAILETKASEHSARMIAMQNATENAKELVGKLTLNYNKTRQSAITSELLEITTAAAALE